MADEFTRELFLDAWPFSRGKKYHEKFILVPLFGSLGVTKGKDYVGMRRKLACSKSAPTTRARSTCLSPARPVPSDPCVRRLPRTAGRRSRATGRMGKEEEEEEEEGRRDNLRKLRTKRLPPRLRAVARPARNHFVKSIAPQSHARRAHERSLGLSTSKCACACRLCLCK